MSNEIKDLLNDIMIEISNTNDLLRGEVFEVVTKPDEYDDFLEYVETRTMYESIRTKYRCVKCGKYNDSRDHVKSGYGCSCRCELRVNGVDHKFKSDQVSYDDIVRVAGFHPETNPSITYSNAHNGQGGILAPGEVLWFGMNTAITVSDTSNA